MNFATEIEKHKRAELTRPVFSILIPSWNNLPYLKLCVESIRKNSSLVHQIIIHINEGKEGSYEWVKTQRDLDFTYSKENIGICYALNAGRSIAIADYIVYINDDMYVCPGWDKILMDEIEKIGHNNFFLSSTTIEPNPHSNCSIKENFGIDIGSFEEEKLLKEFKDLEMKDWQGSTSPPNIVHKDVWDLVGGYSIEFSPGMYSDPDFSLKLWKMGIRLFKGVSNSRAYHFGSVSLKKVRKNKGYYTFVSKWALTQNTFTKYFLQRGAIFNGPLPEPSLNVYFSVKTAFKQFKAIFKRD